MINVRLVKGLALLSSLVWVLQSEANTPVKASLQAQADIVHFELEGRRNWVYDLRREKKKDQAWAHLTVEALDPQSRTALTSFKSDLVRQVSVNPQGPDGKTVVSFLLADEEVETFDYQTDQPSRLIVDFYVTEKTRKKLNKVAAEKPAAPPVQESQAKKPTQKKTTTSRTPANTDVLVIQDQGVQVAQLSPSSNEIRAGIFDGADPDYERFSIKDYEIKEEAILRSQDNYYIPFPMRQGRNEFWDQVKAAQPIYSLTPKPNDENKMARLLLNLFERKRLSVYLKTLDWFKEKYPQSEYLDLISYMTGDVYLQRWQSEGKIEDYERAIQAYQAAIQKYPKAPTAERTSLMLGFYALERGDSLGALRFFSSHIENPAFGDTDVFSKDLARLGLGFAYMKLFRTAEAFQAFDDLEKRTTHPDLKAEASFRKGDVFVAAKQPDRAIEEYQKSLKSYPGSGERSAGAYFNRAEALFSNGKYKESLDTFREFLKFFPSDDHAPFALTRIGELLEILGADPRRVMGTYLETAFRYGENPKAIVARLRMLSARMKGMKPKETESAVAEILNLAQKLDLPNIQQFATVQVADGYMSRGEYQKAADLLIRYYQENPTAPDLDRLQKRIVANIGEKFRSEVEKGDFIQALKTHQVYAETWLKGADRPDIRYFLGRAFEQGGALSSSLKIYQDVLNRIYAAKGTPDEKKLMVLSQLPSTDKLNLRLASVAAGLQDAKKSYEYLKQIKSPETLSDEEQIERIDLAVRLLENRGELDSAVRFLTELLKEWKGRPELVAEPYLRLAQIETKQGRNEEAIRSLKKIDQLMQDSGKVSPEVHAKALEAWGDLELAKGAGPEAIQIYSQLLEKYEDQRPLASIRYRLGRIHFDRGEMQKAAEVWNTFKGERNDFWKNLAQEQLKNSEWREDYKKYIQRIPAMAR